MAQQAVSFGAEGIGLCRTEHMFFDGDRINFMRQMILAVDEVQRRSALKKLLPFQKKDFVGLFRAMNGRPVTIRLLDPPLHEFLPQDDVVRRQLAEKLDVPFDFVIDRIKALHEENPMLGCRGCRLGILYPEITEMQARAIFEAAVQVQKGKKRIKVKPEIMIPLVGFREELEFILHSTPKNRRTLLFSATISKGIERLASRYQNNALRISTLVKNEQHLDIEYQAITVAARDTEHAIMNVLRYHDANNALVFCGTRANVNHLAARLNNRGFSVVSISGELSQKERLNALRSIKNGQSKVCVATDVAARGIDLPNLELVIHADLPKTKESLLHRSGRTGRAGNKGISALIVPSESGKKVQL